MTESGNCNRKQKVWSTRIVKRTTRVIYYSNSRSGPNRRSGVIVKLTDDATVVDAEEIIAYIRRRKTL